MKILRITLIGLIVIVFALTGLNWYQNQHRARLTLNNRDKPYRIVLLGDSLAEGVGSTTPEAGFAGQFLNQVKRQYPLATVQNLGQSGAKINDVLETQRPQINPPNPDLVLVLVGTNDVTGLTTLATFTDDYTTLATHLSTLNSSVLVFTIPDFSQTPIVPAEIRAIAQSKAKQYNNVIVEAVKNRTRFKVFDFYSLSHRFLTQESDLLSEDKFHPNDRGYRIMAQEAAQVLGF